MERVDDVQMFMRKGAASPVAYHMAAPLLADIANSLQVSNSTTQNQLLSSAMTNHIGASSVKLHLSFDV